MWCRSCSTNLENYSSVDGGWCPKCKTWIPDDICRDAIIEEFGGE